MVTLFVRGYLVETLQIIFKETKPRKGTIFILAEEYEDWLDSLKQQQYLTQHPQLYYHCSNDDFKTLYIRCKLPKTYVYKDDKVIFWSNPIPIERVHTNEVLDIKDCLVGETTADNTN